MNIAAMRVRVIFQKNAVTVDKYGNHKTGWTDYFSCWATVGNKLRLGKLRRRHQSGGIAGLHLPLLLRACGC